MLPTSIQEKPTPELLDKVISTHNYWIDQQVTEYAIVVTTLEFVYLKEREIFSSQIGICTENMSSFVRSKINLLFNCGL